jgi:hypothetical protein
MLIAMFAEGSEFLRAGSACPIGFPILSDRKNRLEKALGRE